MAHKILYSTNNKPIYSTNNRPVYSPEFLRLVFTEVRTDDLTYSIYIYPLYSLDDISWEYGDLTIARVAASPIIPVSGGWSAERSTYFTMDFHETHVESPEVHHRNYGNGGWWAWNGTYWQISFFGFTYKAGRAANISVTVVNDWSFGETIEAGPITKTHNFAVRAQGESMVTSDGLICTVRYTPSTNVLEYV